MTPYEHTTIEVKNGSGASCGTVHIALLPQYINRKSTIPPLVIVKDMTSADAMPNVQLLEGCEYRYEFHDFSNIGGIVTTDRVEIFQADTQSGRSGRVRPDLYTGTLPITVKMDDHPIGFFSLEVRSRKLSYLDEYRWMVKDVAEQMAEVVMNRFAAAEQKFRVDDTRDANTLYQRFAFLKSLISGEDFQAAISEIVRRPHVSWENIDETAHPSKGLKAGSYVSRQLAKGGARQPWDHPLLATIPQVIHRQRTEVTVDTTPNRFVKFAIQRWHAVVSQIAEILTRSSSNPAIDRGVQEVQYTINYLDAILAEGLFRELSSLDSFPADNQVLHKREGYRDIFRAYIQFDVAAKLSWEGGEDVYGAGKKDVATLYEYWVFIKLAQLVSVLCDVPFEFSDLIQIDNDRMNIGLKMGKTCVLDGMVERRGRKMDVQLWFNKTFSANDMGDGSWSKQMRPDYSLKISPAKGEAAYFEPVYVHFDAKYRINHITDVFELDDEDENNQSNQGSKTAKRDDLLKMHAYRDAIRRSAGAYVLYPGDEKQVFKEYHELLPGLGAFALRPTASGEPNGKLPLKRFIEDILEHVATQISQHERGRYWVKEVYSGRDYLTSALPVAPFLNAPPADTLVLLGYVKNKEHWEWIEKNKLYNIRGDGRRGSIGLGNKELACDLILLSCPDENKTRLVKITEAPQLHDREDMKRMRYPIPRGPYYCFNIDFIIEDTWSSYFDCVTIEKLRNTKNTMKGHPVVVTWLELSKQFNKKR